MRTHKALLYNNNSNNKSEMKKLKYQKQLQQFNSNAAA